MGSSDIWQRHATNPPAPCLITHLPHPPTQQAVVAVTGEGLGGSLENPSKTCTLSNHLCHLNEYAGPATGPSCLKTQPSHLHPAFQKGRREIILKTP